MKAKTIVKFQTTKKPSINDVLKITKGGQFFHVVWRKDGGELAARSFRRGVKKGVTGKGLNFNPIKKGLLPVYDPAADMRGETFFKLVRAKNIISIKARGIKYVWIKPDPWADGGEIDQRINNINQLTKIINR
jgi:hypothetical protein